MVVDIEQNGNNYYQVVIDKYFFENKKGSYSIGTGLYHPVINV